ncbi:MAG TPA: hypothetical protein VIC26_07085 [Marinagarivorans sp.]
MINRTLICCAILLLPNLVQAQNQGVHSGYIEAGSLEFNWREFAYNDDPFDDDEENEIKTVVVDEDGSLGSLAVGYSYYRDDRLFSIEISQNQGKVDYYGRIPLAGDRNDYWEHLTTDYTIYSLEATFGHYFDVDYVTPFAAIIGGYSARERTINGMSQSVTPSGSLIDIETINEDMSYYYWAALLDIEVFSWNNFSANIGAKYRRSVKNKQKFVENNVTADLEPLVATEILASISYEFLPSWEASLRYKTINSKMEQNYPTSVPDSIEGIVQPRSEEDHSYLALRLQKSF